MSDTETSNAGTPAAGSQAKRVFYGWRVVALSVLAGFMVYGVGLYSFTLFVRPLTLEFHWDRAILGGAISAFWISAPLALFTGTLVTRFGTRALIVTGVLIEGLSLGLFSLIDTLWPLYVLRIAMGVGKVLVTVCLPVLVSQWFSVRYGLALAIALTGFHLGGLVMAPVTQLLLDALGWRYTAVTLGALMIVLMVPATLWVLRAPTPAALGLERDGSEPQAASPGMSSATVQEGFELTLRQAAGTVSFWLLMSATVLFYFAYSSILAHAAAFLVETGVPAQSAATTVGLTAGAAVVGLLLSGIAVGRWPLTRLLLVLFAGLVIGLLLILAVSVTHVLALRYAFVCVFGPVVGAIDVVCMSFLRTRFGPRHYAHLFGAWYFFSLAGLLLGPVVAGEIYDVSASYQAAFAAALTAAVVGLLLTVPLRIPPVTDTPST